MRLITAVIIALVLSVPAWAGDFDFLAEINIGAKSDPVVYRGDLSVRFGQSSATIDAVIRVADEPADAFMILKIGELTKTPPEKLITIYKRDKGKGWGAMAKEMGIKPGSKEFMELKRGERLEHGGKGKDKNKDKEKGGGHGKGKGK